MYMYALHERVLKSHLIAKNRKYHRQKIDELNWEGGTEDDGFNIYIYQYDIYTLRYMDKVLSITVTSRS